MDALLKMSWARTAVRPNFSVKGGNGLQLAFDRVQEGIGNNFPLTHHTF
jgi:hypothetical protein